MADSPNALSGWLPNLIGPLDLEGDGSPFVQRRQTLNFVGATVVDNPAQDRTDITLSGGGGSGGGGAAVTVVEAVTATPGWYVVGSFYAESGSTVTIETIGCVSDSGLALNMRLFDVTDRLPVSGSTSQITATTDARVESAPVALQVGHQYQMQAECIGLSGFGVVTAMGPK